MKLLLTSGGITNKSIAKSLQKLLGKLFSKSKLVFIPTAPNLSLSSQRNRDLFKLYYEDEMKESPAIEKGSGFIKFHVHPHFNSPHFPHTRANHLAEVAKTVKETIYVRGGFDLLCKNFRAFSNKTGLKSTSSQAQGFLSA